MTWREYIETRTKLYHVAYIPRPHVCSEKRLATIHVPCDATISQLRNILESNNLLPVRTTIPSRGSYIEYTCWSMQFKSVEIGDMPPVYTTCVHTGTLQK